MDEWEVRGWNAGVDAIQTRVVIRAQGNMYKAREAAEPYGPLDLSRTTKHRRTHSLGNQFICCRIEDFSDSEVGGRAYIIR
jgi:hypothetical protein